VSILGHFIIVVIDRREGKGKPTNDRIAEHVVSVNRVRLAVLFLLVFRPIVGIHAFKTNTLSLIRKKKTAFVFVVENTLLIHYGWWRIKKEEWKGKQFYEINTCCTV
jgi:hypothetical protein